MALASSRLAKRTVNIFGQFWRQKGQINPICSLVSKGLIVRPAASASPPPRFRLVPSAEKNGPLTVAGLCSLAVIALHGPSLRQFIGSSCRPTANFVKKNMNSASTATPCSSSNETCAKKMRWLPHRPFPATHSFVWVESNRR